MDSEAKPKQQISRRKRYVIIFACISSVTLVAVITSLTFFTAKQQQAHQSNPIPQTLRSQLPFTAYYPTASKLPKGYVLDTASFTIQQKTSLVFAIKYDSAQKKLVVSEQATPSDAEVEGFYANYIPLRNHIQVALGSAEIGAYRNGGTLQTVASLPIHDDTWVIVTGPYDTDQDKLKQVLEALTK